MKRKGSKSCSNRLDAKLQSKSSKNASILVSIVFSATPYDGEEVEVVEVRLGESVRIRAVLGMFDGEDDGDDEGQNEGLVEGRRVGEMEGIIDGDDKGRSVGLIEGRHVGALEGVEDGFTLGADVGY
jgi:hypothetical protein